MQITKIIEQKSLRSFAQTLSNIHTDPSSLFLNQQKIITSKSLITIQIEKLTCEKKGTKLTLWLDKAKLKYYPKQKVKNQLVTKATVETILRDH